MQFKTLYGPVRSGRLGLSLGVDLLGRRICSLDCIYCEVGPTRVHTLERRAYLPATTILDELRAWKDRGLPRPEFITLGGLGEPCLNTQLGAIIAGSRHIFPDIPVAILTNSTLLHDPAVRVEMAASQVVLPSLDTLVPEEFLRINKPCTGVSLERITSGLLTFRAEFPGRMYLEILLIRGFNDSKENLALLREFIPRLRPDRVDVVTLTRPGASPLAEAVDKPTLTSWQEELGNLSAANGGTARLMHVAGAARSAPLAADIVRELVLNSLRRRPQTLDQVRAALDLETGQAQDAFANLLNQGAIRQDKELGEDFFRAKP